MITKTTQTECKFYRQELSDGRAYFVMETADGKRLVLHAGSPLFRSEDKILEKLNKPEKKPSLWRRLFT